MQNFFELTFVPKYFTQKGIIAFCIVMLACVTLFINQALPVQWILFGAAEVLLFFIFSTRFTKKWASATPEIYVGKLFRVSFGIRIVWVLFSYIYFTQVTGQPFEFETGDAMGYHGEGIWLAGLLNDGKFDVYLAYIGTNYSDMGYPFYLGLLYFALGEEILVPRLIKALLGAITCIFIYKIGRNNFGESTGRIAGILAMLLPNLIYYCGLHVKETEMVFLTVSFVYMADTALRSQYFDIKTIAIALLLGGALFFFRTILALSVLASFGISILLVSQRISNLNKKLVMSVAMVLVIAAVFSGPFNNTIMQYLEESDKNITSQMDNFASREGGNTLARYGSRSIFLPVMLMAPFPTLVNTNQPNAMMMNGAMFTKNVYAFFVYVALWMLIKKRLWRRHALLLSVLFSYLFILASSGFALSERFHIPIVPFLLILAAFGISQMNMKNRKYFIPYLMIVSVIVIGWNWFKMAGRGLD